MSARAIIAWGVDFGQPDLTGEGFDFEEHGLDTYDMEGKHFPALFGFTEESPDSAADGCTAEERRAWYETVRQPYNDRRDAAVPVTFQSYGYEYSGEALVLKRSLTEVDWACDPVDTATLALPTADEMEAFRRVFSKWEIGWPMDVRLLLMASYG